MKIVNLKTKEAKFQPIKTPNNIELEYYRQLRFMVEQIYKRFNNIVVEGMDKEYIKEQIVDESYVSLLEKLMIRFRKSIKRQFGLLRIVGMSTDITKFVYDYNEKRWLGELSKFGIDLKKDISFDFLKDYLSLRINDNVKLIKNLQEEFSYDLEQTIYKSFENGKTYKELSKDISDRFGIGKRKAALIARNEVKNTNTQLNKKRMQEYGVDKAIWMSADDERVRSQHQKFDGKEYEVGKGLKNEKGEYEEPGDAISCRCVAIPII